MAFLFDPYKQCYLCFIKSTHQKTREKYINTLCSTNNSAQLTSVVSAAASLSLALATLSAMRESSIKSFLVRGLLQPGMGHVIICDMEGNRVNMAFFEYVCLHLALDDNISNYFTNTTSLLVYTL